MSQIVIDRTVPLSLPDDPIPERDVVLNRVDRLLGELISSSQPDVAEIQAVRRVRTLLSERIEPVPNRRARSAYLMLGIVQGDIEPITTIGTIVLGRHQVIVPHILGLQGPDLKDVRSQVDRYVDSIFDDAHTALGEPR